MGTTSAASAPPVFPTRVGVNRLECADVVVTLNVFPTRVGVNRCTCGCRRRLMSIPHTRGGEPLVNVWLYHPTSVFPTRVGVNRCGRGG